MPMEATDPATEMDHEYFLGAKGARCVRLQPYHFNVPIVLKTGNLKVRESSRPVQAYPRTALPLPFVTPPTNYYHNYYYCY